MMKILIGVIVGGGIGFLYYRFIGCRGGACMITSHPLISTLYWALLGGFLAGSM